MKAENFKFTDNGEDTLMIRVSGAAYQNLLKIAEAMNSVTWRVGDNTALTVAEHFVFNYEVETLTNPTEALEMAFGIAEGIDTETEDEAEDDKRRKALQEAFSALEFIEG